MKASRAIGVIVMGLVGFAACTQTETAPRATGQGAPRCGRTAAHCNHDEDCCDTYKCVYGNHCSQEGDDRP